MPYFTIYTRDRLNELLGYLEGTFHVVGSPAPLPVSVTAAALTHARQMFATTCAGCHGAAGTGETPVARELAPPPPDLTRSTLEPQPAFEVVTVEYPGTAMPSFAAVPEDVRWGLVKLVNALYREEP